MNEAETRAEYQIPAYAGATAINKHPPKQPAGNG